VTLQLLHLDYKERAPDGYQYSGADQVEGRVLRVDRDGLLVDPGGRLVAVRHSWSEVGTGGRRLPRRAGR
jgi:hypothetical protein